MGQFEESLGNFTRDFAYGGAIRHLCDHGYTAEQILKEYKYPLSLESIQKIIDNHMRSKKDDKRQD